MTEKTVHWIIVLTFISMSVFFAVMLNNTGAGVTLQLIKTQNEYKKLKKTFNKVDIHKHVYSTGLPEYNSSWAESK